VAARVSWADVEVGTELPAQTFHLDRAALVRYAGASGDFNVIHWNQRVATEVGLPDVIAHGMLTMALGGRVVTDWLGDPGALVSYGVRFTRPVVVPDDGQGATVEVSAKVSAKNDDSTVAITLTVKSRDVTVLGKAQAIVRLP
jgi:acyl dehydratase